MLAFRFLVRSRHMKLAIRKPAARKREDAEGRKARMRLCFSDFLRGLKAKAGQPLQLVALKKSVREKTPFLTMRAMRKVPGE